MASFSQSQVSANYAWLEATTGYSNPPTARSHIPSSAQQSYTGPTAHYRVGSASPGGINRGRPLPSGGAQASFTADPFVKYQPGYEPSVPRITHPRPTSGISPSVSPRPYTYTPKTVAPYGNVASNPGTATRTYNHPQASAFNPQYSTGTTAPKTTVTPRAPRGPVASWNAAARAGANATSATAANLATRLNGMTTSQALGALGLAGVASGSISNAQITAQNQAITYSGSIPANYATAYGAKIPFGTGPSTGSNLPGISTPTGAAPGAGAVATGAAAAGAGLAALSGWLGEGVVAVGPLPPPVPAVDFDPQEGGDFADRGGVKIRGYSGVFNTWQTAVVDSYWVETRSGSTSSTYPRGIEDIHGVVTGGGGLPQIIIAGIVRFASNYWYTFTISEPDGTPIDLADLGTPGTESQSAPRSVPDPLAAPPNTRDTNNPPRTPAPARTTTPRRTPTAPKAPPLNLPSPQPIPPGILPAGDPLNPPAPVENPTAPTTPPQADPQTVPKPTPTTPPSNTPRQLPRETGTGTGTQVIDTPTGPAEVATPPGGLAEQPTGTTITTVKPLPEQDDSWYIPPLLIGGGLAIGTAIATGLKVDDPTTPGKFTQAPKAPTPPKIDTPTDSKCRCNGPILSAIGSQAAGNAAVQAQLARIEANQNNPVSGFAALQVGQAGILGLLQSVNTFMRKAWEMTRMQKVLDVLTFIGVMHNVSMLSRDVGETFFQVLSQGIQAVGIRDEEDNPIDLYSTFTGGLETFLRNVLGSDVYDGINEAWNKANRIVTTAGSVIWTIRSISDASLDLMEWVAENTGKIGNSLKRWGVVGEHDYPWMSERAQARNRLRSRFNKVTETLENAEDRISVYGQATSGFIELQEETSELTQNFSQFKDSVINGIPDPWDDNVPIKTVYDGDKALSEAPEIPVSDSQKG